VPPIRSRATWRARLDHTASLQPTSLEFCCPEVAFIATRTDEVATVLGEAEAAAGDGLHVLGFVSYDAAGAFDSAFVVPTAEENHLAEPLACFVGFTTAENAEPITATRGGRGSTWSPDDTPGTHSKVVRLIRDSIAAGDAYLVNHTVRFRRELGSTDEPFELYRRLVTNYGHGWHHYLEFEDVAVACGSPELFFSIEGNRITTQPMKGTAPRGRWVAEDDQVADLLSSSDKELAENVMVVDLLRNDLGRICVPGSIAVPALGTLERHPSLWQLTSTVTGEISSDVGLAEVFGALFPSASVTGAPKIAAMHLIAEHETSARGLYCGAIGYLAPGGGRATFAVAIRTAVCDLNGQRASYGSGGGISWDSDTNAEWDELLVKAASIEGPAQGLLGPDEGLFETMGFDPATSAIANLEGHLARLTSSARYFGLEVPEDLEEQVANCVDGLAEPTRLRVTLLSDGLLEFTISPLIPHTVPQRLVVDLEPVCSSEVRLFHKTTDRHLYEARTARHPEADQVVMINERGELTETDRASLFVKLDGWWWTPPLSSGLLPGVGRATVLSAEQANERILVLADLIDAEEIAVVSSLRGWTAASLVGCLAT
jgi:para-aminobenzoate synthetase / 4-amino-4-deoxychorismate lyase